MPTPARYDAVARVLHWLIVVLLVAQYAIGWTMPDVHRDTRPVGLIAAHLIVGTALLAAMACRVLWRATHRPPADQLSPTMRALSGATHVALYALLIAVPLLGWINASSRAWAVTLSASCRCRHCRQPGRDSGTRWATCTASSRGCCSAVCAFTSQPRSRIGSSCATRSCSG